MNKYPIDFINNNCTKISAATAMFLCLTAGNVLAAEETPQFECISNPTNGIIAAYGDGVNITYVEKTGHFSTVPNNESTKFLPVVNTLERRTIANNPDTREETVAMYNKSSGKGGIVSYRHATGVICTDGVNNIPFVVDATRLVSEQAKELIPKPSPYCLIPAALVFFVGLFTYVVITNDNPREDGVYPE